MRTIAPNSIYRCYFDSACDGTEKGAAQGNDTLNVSKIHFDELAAAKAAHLAAKQEGREGKLAANSAHAKKGFVRPENRVVYVEFADGKSDIRIPYIQTKLSNGDTILRYVVDTELESTEQRKAIRAPFIAARGENAKTQLEYAKEGIITPEMEYVALRESACFLEQITDPEEFRNKFHTSEGVIFGDGVIKLERDKMSVTPEMVRDEIARGRAVIPSNIKHPECEPMIIGKHFLTKVNANIGASSVSSGFKEEIGKLKTSLKYGADTVMDLSTGLEDLSGLRSAILRASPVPIGTVPIYETLDRAGGDANALNWELFRQVIIDQCEQGVDYFTIHAGLTKDLLPYAADRVMGIVSRGGAIMASHMMQHDCENMAWEHFDELMEICRKYDVSLSLGDGLRPGGIYDACDEAQYGELRNIGKLARRCYEAGVQTFIEGPGHVPLNRVEENQRLEDEYCNEAPFYTLGPLVTDIGAGFDHFTSAIGATTIGMHGTAMLCYVTPSEHLALPTPEDVREGLITYKIAAHSADLGKGLKQAYNIDHAMSRARVSFRWLDQFILSFDEQNAYKIWRREMDDEDCLSHDAAFCSMCGPRFCPMRLNRRMQAKYPSPKA